MAQDRLATLHKKAEKIQVELTTWARRNFSLNPGERFVVTIDVVKDSLVTVIPPLSLEKGKRRYNVADVLTQKDWSRILSISWIGVQKSIIEIFREKINQSVSTSELGIAHLGSSRIERINATLRVYNLPFAIRDRKRSGNWQDAELYMYRVEAER